MWRKVKKYVHNISHVNLMGIRFLDFPQIILLKTSHFFLPICLALQNNHFGVLIIVLRPTVAEIFKVLNTVRCPMLSLWRINIIWYLDYLWMYIDETWYVASTSYGIFVFAHKKWFLLIFPVAANLHTRPPCYSYGE